MKLFENVYSIKAIEVMRKEFKAVYSNHACMFSWMIVQLLVRGFWEIKDISLIIRVMLTWWITWEPVHIWLISRATLLWNLAFAFHVPYDYLYSQNVELRQVAWRGRIHISVYRKTMNLRCPTLQAVFINSSIDDSRSKHKIRWSNGKCILKPHTTANTQWKHKIDLITSNGLSPQHSPSPWNVFGIGWEGWVCIPCGMLDLQKLIVVSVLSVIC